jgi:hypothetical protein
VGPRVPRAASPILVRARPRRTAARGWIANRHLTIRLATVGRVLAGDLRIRAAGTTDPLAPQARARTGRVLVVLAAQVLAEPPREGVVQGELCVAQREKYVAVKPSLLDGAMTLVAASMGRHVRRPVVRVQPSCVSRRSSSRLAVQCGGMSDLPIPDSYASPIQADNQGTLLHPRWHRPVPIVTIVNENGSTTVTLTEQHGLCVGEQAVIAGTVNTYLQGAFRIACVPTPFSLQYCQRPPDSPWPPPSDKLRPRIPDTDPGPPVPPIQGREHFHHYGYFVLPYINIKPSDNMVYFLYNPRQSVELQIMQKRMYAEKVGLITGATAYRIPKQYLWLLKYTCDGPYIGNPPQLYHVRPEDPTRCILPSGPWVPVY